MRFFIEVNEHEQLPRFYGYAWINYHKLTKTVAPIPFNFLVRWGRILWFKLVKGSHDNDLDAYVSGKRRGWQEARQTVIEMDKHGLDIKKIIEGLK